MPASGQKRSSTQQILHPYANASSPAYERDAASGAPNNNSSSAAGAGNEYGAYRGGNANNNGSNVAMGGSTPARLVGVSNGDYHDDENPRKFSLVKFLTCRCG